VVCWYKNTQQITLITTQFQVLNESVLDFAVH
jgi:hypothetical protein